MRKPGEALTSEALTTLQTIVESGSFAAAARELNLVASGLTYRVRQLEEAIGVPLFERGTRKAKLTDAGRELLRESGHLLAELDAMTARVRQVATGWEDHFTISVEGVISRPVLMELCEQFYEQQAPTRLKIRTDILSGTLESVSTGEADIAIGVMSEVIAKATVNLRSLGSIPFVFVVAPDHPLAKAPEPLTDAMIRRYRAVVIADSARRRAGASRGVFEGQEALTVTDLEKKIEAQVSGLGIGFLPLSRAQPIINAGALLIKKLSRANTPVQVFYAWRKEKKAEQGKALQWWLQQLKSPITRAALVQQVIGSA